MKDYEFHAALARRVGAEPGEFGENEVAILLDIGRGMMWSRVLHCKANLLAAEVDETLTPYRFQNNELPKNRE